VVSLPQTIPAGGVASIAVRGGDNAAALSAAAISSRLDALLPLIVLLWFAGVMMLMVRLASGLWQVHRLQVAAGGAAVSRWQSAAERIARRLGLHAEVRVVESTFVDAPSAVGWVRPVILLPIAAFAGLTPSQVEGILAHELIHIRRHDYLVNLAQTVAETLLFFHPGVWWVSRQIRVEREHCCDDVGVQICGDAVNYAAALAELESRRCPAVSRNDLSTRGHERIARQPHPSRSECAPPTRDAVARRHRRAGAGVRAGCCDRR
jgi:beta-lactamase regulating signal transducer with metallopeptidase domain